MFNSPLGAESKKQEGIEPSSACFSGNMRVLPVIRLLRIDAGRTARKTPWVPAAPAGRCLRDALRAVIRKKRAIFLKSVPVLIFKNARGMDNIDILLQFFQIMLHTQKLSDHKTCITL